MQTKLVGLDEMAVKLDTTVEELLDAVEDGIDPQPLFLSNGLYWRRSEVPALRESFDEYLEDDEAVENGLDGSSD